MEFPYGSSAAALFVPLLLIPLVVLAGGVGAQGQGCVDPEQVVTEPDGWTRIRAPQFSAGPQELTAYAVDPISPERLFATNGKVLERSTDGGCTWDTMFSMLQVETAVVPFPGSTTIHSIVIPPNAASSGRYHYMVLREHLEFQIEVPDRPDLRGDQGVRPGVLRSSAGGDVGTWERTPLLTTAGETGEPPYGEPVELVVHEASPDTVYLAAWHWNGGRDTVLYASHDAGESWELVNWGHLIPSDAQEQQTPSRFSDLAVDPLDPETMWGAVGSVSATGPSGLWRSLDGGETWEREGDFDGGVVAVEVLATPGAPSQIWAVLDREREGVSYRSDDGGETWLLVEEIPDKQGSLVLDPNSTALGESADDLFVTVVTRPDEVVELGEPPTPPSGAAFGYDARAGRWLTLKETTSVLHDASADRASPPSFYARTADAIYRSPGFPDGFAGTDEVAPPPSEEPPLPTPWPGAPPDGSCVLESAPEPDWKPDWDPLPESSGPVYVSNFDSGEIIRFSRHGRGDVVGLAPRTAENMAVDPLGRIVVATRFSNILTRHDPWTCEWQVIDDYLREAEGPVFDAEGNLFVNSTGVGSARGGRIFEYPWPQYPGSPRHLVGEVSGQFIEDVVVAPPASPFAGDLFVNGGGCHYDEGCTSIARFTRGPDGWERAPDVVTSWKALLPQYPGFGSIGIAFHPDGRLFVPSFRAVRDVTDPVGGERHVVAAISPDGSSAEVFATRSVGADHYWHKIDVMFDGYVYVTAANSFGNHPSPRGWVHRFDPEGNVMEPSFDQNLTIPVGIAVPHFPPPSPPPPSDDPDDTPGNDPVPRRGGPGLPPPPGPLTPLAPPAPLPAPLPVPAPAPAPAPAPGPAQAPAPAGQMQAQASGVAQAAAMPQAGMVHQQQEQPQTALARASERVAEQQEYSMSARSRRRDEPIGLSTIAAGAMALAFGCLALRRRNQRAEARRG